MSDCTRHALKYFQWPYVIKLVSCGTTVLSLQEWLEPAQMLVHIKSQWKKCVFFDLHGT